MEHAVLRKEVGWFLVMYCYKISVQIISLTGSFLDPMPPKASKIQGTRYLHIDESDDLDEWQLSDWVEQALSPPGPKLSGFIHHRESLFFIAIRLSCARDPARQASVLHLT
jgi:hypothetical protein